jgi:glycosyltransferase involved in cell wall biosynthesis
MLKSLIINGRFLSRRLTGVDRFGCEIIRAINGLIENDDPVVSGLDFQILAPPGGAYEEFSRISLKKVGFFRGQLWEQVDFSFHSRNAVISINLCNTGPCFSASQIVVIHDAATEAIPSSFSPAFRRWYRFLMPFLGRHASAVLTVSKFSRDELIRAFDIEPAKIKVVSEGCEHILNVAPDIGFLVEKKLTARPYILAVSSMAIHKNFQIVLDALALLRTRPFDVVIAGGANPRVFGSAGVVEATGVHWVGYVTDGQLRALYENALGFVFPSLYEGFGIPPLEAMVCGCPVIASNAASIPEVCGEAALYFSPDDAAGLAAAMLTLVGDEATRDLLRSRGLERARSFSWERAARQVVEACRAGIEDGA